MSNNPHPQRRDFLKTAAAGAAGAIGIGALRFDKLNAQSTGGWVNGMQINPAIDNKRVICCHDPKMLTAVPTNKDFTNTNNAIAPAVVAANLDEMAMQLAQKSTADAAWSTIFRSSKAWGSTRVAMKTNGIGGSTTNRPKWAIYKKLCDVLINLGVSPTNIVLYDACDDASVYYNAYISTTDTTKIRSAPTSVRAAGMGGFQAVTLTNATGISVAADLASGAIDILVNVAACKMHNGTGGHFNYICTLCMKNHLGTFTDGTKAQHSDNLHVAGNGTSPPPAPLAIFEINKHSAILGGNPVRQQLCIVDAILSNGASGPGGAWDNRTDRLVMGTFAPIVDYFATNKILLDNTIMSTSPMPALGVTNAATIVPMFLTNFGYAETDTFQWIEYTPDSPPPLGGSTGSAGGTSGSGGAGSGGTNASGGAASGGNSATSGGRGGGNNSSGGAASGGNSATGGARSGGNNSTGGAASGGNNSTGGAASGGNNSTGGAASGGNNSTGGAASGGNNSTGGASSGGTTSGSGGAGATGGVTTASASGGSATTGGATSGNGTGGSSGNPGSTATPENSGSGCDCDVAGVDRRATRWGAMLAFGAVVAEKLRRLVSGNDQSS